MLYCDLCRCQHQFWSIPLPHWLSLYFSENTYFISWIDSPQSQTPFFQKYALSNPPPQIPYPRACPCPGPNAVIHYPGRDAIFAQSSHREQHRAPQGSPNPESTQASTNQPTTEVINGATKDENSTNQTTTEVTIEVTNHVDTTDKEHATESTVHMPNTKAVQPPKPLLPCIIPQNCV